MSAPPRTRQVWFLGGALLVTLILAGAASYFASSSPDGLDTVTQRGCEVTAVDGAEQLSGECIARNAEDHALQDGTFAGYSVDGDSRLTGVAGVVGVLATLAVAGGLFWLLARRRTASSAGTAGDSGDSGEADAPAADSSVGTETAALSIAADASPQVVRQGDQLTIEIVVTNAGPGTDPGVTVKAPCPRGWSSSITRPRTTSARASSTSVRWSPDRRSP